MTARRAGKPVTAADVAKVVVRLAGEVELLKRRLAKMEGARRKIGFQATDARGEVVEKEIDEDQFDGEA